MEQPAIINVPSADKWTLKDLKYTCKKHKIKGYTKMTKEELVVEVNKIINKLSEDCKLK